MINVLQKTIRIVLDVLCKVIITISIIVVIAMMFGMNFYVVPTGSMEPNIHAGSLVMVNKNIEYSEIEKGDVIVYTRNSDNLRIIHRVIDINEEGILTQGDANAIADGQRVNENMFIGEYVFAIPKLGTYLSSNSVRFAYCSVLIGLFSVDAILDKKVKVSDEKKEEIVD